MNRRPAPTKGRPTAALVAWVLVLSQLLVTVPALAQSPGQIAAGFDLFGIGGAGTVSPTMAAQLVDSSYGLGALDLTTGHLHGGDVGHPSSLDTSVGLDLMAQDMMLVDINRVAEQARLDAERKRLAAEADAAKRGVALERSSDPGTPESWELSNFSTCGTSENARYQARTELVALWEAMCRDAADDGVLLRVNSAYRDPVHQKRLFDAAVAEYGSHAAARRWVAWSDGRSCSSRHCSGTAIDISLSRTPGAQAWLHARVGCAAPGRPDLSRTTCGPGERSIKRVQLYGLVLPMDHEPWHVELGIPLTTEATCNPPGSYDMPQVIAAVWRCRLSEAGLAPQAVDRAVAEALVVAKCESGLDPNAVAFGGRYMYSPHPVSGFRYTAAGLFQIIRATADTWVEGGYAAVHDPVANADGAARLWLDGWSRGGRSEAWRPWACAVPANDGINRDGSVLPGFPGGPAALPSWATSY